jgi:hypothetical protein
MRICASGSVRSVIGVEFLMFHTMPQQISRRIWSNLETHCGYQAISLISLNLYMTSLRPLIRKM